MTRVSAVQAALLVLALISAEAMSATAAIDPAGTRVAVPVRSMQELRFSHLVPQTWDVSCGAAALSTVLTYDLGRPVSEYTVATWILRGVDPQRVRARGGFSLLDLKRFAKAAGYEAEGYGGMTFEELVALRTSAIVPVRIHGLDHFVVMRGAIADRVVLGDPAFGNLTVSTERFQQLWKGGIAFVVFREGDPTPVADPLAPEIADLRVPDLPSVERLLRGTGPAPLTRTMQPGAR
ncbi:MAG TPA: C39 family peptidase [Steroidobacteraceae bacterium]|jgi:predicted double-glycine peptidase